MCKALLTIFAVLFLGSSFAECVWRQFDGKYYIECDVENITVGGGVNTDGWACSNCTKVTVEECNERKQLVKDTVSLELPHLAVSKQDTMSAIEQISYLRSEIDEWVDISDFGTSVSDAASISNSPQFAYFIAPPLSTTTPSLRNTYLRNAGWSAAQSLYNYGQTVKPFLEAAENSLFNSYSTQSGIESSLQILSTAADGWTCDKCSNDDPSGGGDIPSGGGGQGGAVTNYFVPVGCPCSEYIMAVETAVQFCRDSLNVVTQQLAGISQQITDIDGYIRQYYQSYSNANHYISRSGVPYNPKQIFDQLFSGQTPDYSVIQDLELFGRIEFLLANLNGLFSTNGFNNASALSDQISLTVTGSSSLDSEVSSELPNKSNSDGVLSALKNLQSAFSFNVSSVSDVRIMSDFFGGYPLSVSFDSELIQMLRLVSTVIVTGMYFVLLWFVLVRVYHALYLVVIWFLEKTHRGIT